MKLRSVRLTLANVARTTNSKTLEAISTGKVNKRDESGNFTDELDYVYVDCSAYRGDTLRVKFPAKLENKVDDLHQKLENDVIINISFDKLKLTPYALKASDGSVLSGVSAKAEDFTVESSTMDDMDDIIL